MNRWVVLAMALVLAACGEEPQRLPVEDAGGSGGSGGGSGGSDGSGGSGGIGGAGGGQGGSGGTEMTAPSVVIHLPLEQQFVSGATVPVKGIASGSGDELVSVLLQANEGEPRELLAGPVGETIVDTVAPAVAGENRIVVRARGARGGEAAATATFIGDGGTVLEPTIRSFTATPERLPAGTTVKLRWDVVGTSPVLWIDGFGAVGGTTELDVRPLESRSYTLHADNAAGSASATVAVVVETSGGALRTRPERATVPPGARVPLLVEDANGAALRWDAGAVTPAGTPDSVAIWQAPDAEGDYRITVETQDAARSAVIEVEVRAEAPLPAAWESAGGNVVHVEEPEVRSAADAAGGVWVISARIPGVFHGVRSADRWTALPAPPFPPAALVRAGDGTLYAGGFGDAGVARLAPGAAAWEPIGAGQGTHLALHGDELYRFVWAGAAAPSRVERFDGTGWAAFGPPLTMPQPGRYVVDTAGNHWVGRRLAAGDGPVLHRLPSGGTAWEDAGLPLALAPMLQPGPGGRVLAARGRTLAVYEAGAWTDLSAHVPSGNVSGIGFRPGGEVLFSTYAGAEETLYVEAGDGTFVPSAARLAGVRLGSRLVEAPDGTVVRIGVEGVYTLAPGASSWQLLGGRGLGRAPARLIRSDAGVLAAESRGFHLLGDDGAWHEVQLPSDATVAFSWPLAGGFGLLLSDGSLIHVDHAGTATVVRTLAPEVAALVLGAAEADDGTVVLRSGGETLVFRPGATTPEVLAGGDSFFRFVAAPHGNLWGTGGRATGRLERGGTRWQPGIAFTFPPFDGTQLAVSMQRTTVGIALPTTWPCLVPYLTGVCDPPATHLLAARVESVGWDPAGGRLYASTDDGLFALSKETSAWVAVGGEELVTALEIMPSGGWLYGRSDQAGVWRTPLVD